MSFVILFTSISMGLQLLFPQLTVYVATNVISLGSIPFALQIPVHAIILAYPCLPCGCSINDRHRIRTVFPSRIELYYISFLIS